MPINLTKIIIGGAATTFCAGGIYAITPFFSKSPLKIENLQTSLPLHIPLPNTYKTTYTNTYTHKNVLSSQEKKEEKKEKLELKSEKVKVSPQETPETKNLNESFNNYLPKGGAKRLPLKKELYLYKNLSYDEELRKIYEADEKKKEFYMSHDFKRKEWDVQKSEKIEQKIRDYTVGLHHKCASGTGWILDYEWPENGEYPKKWFFATNAHVFDKFDFSKSEYKQDHPDKCVGYNTGSFFQMAIWKENKEQQIKKVDVKSTKLFYVARNHLGKADIPEKFDSRNVNVFKPRNLFSGGETESSTTKNNKNNYFHDFIVLEVEFHDQYDAKDATDDFHNKYGNGAEKPINLFHDGITTDEDNFFKEETYTTSYYVGGFPSQWEKQMVFNRNLEKYKGLQASTLSQETYNYALKRMSGGLNALRGLGDNSSFELQWGKGSSDNQNLTGFIYLIDRINIGAGGSGSMVVDENENFLGLYSFGDRNDGEVGGVQPIRSHSLEISKGKKSPKFDLIRGAEGQTSSYKSQLDKYYENKKTFLRVKQFEQFNKSF